MTDADTPAASGMDMERLVVDHLWLADALAHRLRGRGEDEEDLAQVARCALVEAAQRYDPDQGPFLPYAGSTISGVLKRHFRDRGWVVRPPRQTQQTAVRISQQWSVIAQRCQATPRDEDLADGLGESVTSVRAARCAAQAYWALPIDGLAASTAHACEEPGFERCEMQLLVRQVWRLLTVDERELVWMRFWEGSSQSEIAARVGVSQMQVSRLLARIFERVRHTLHDDELCAA